MARTFYISLNLVSAMSTSGVRANARIGPEIDVPFQLRDRDGDAFSLAEHGLYNWRIDPQLNMKYRFAVGETTWERPADFGVSENGIAPKWYAVPIADDVYPVALFGDIGSYKKIEGSNIDNFMSAGLGNDRLVGDDDNNLMFGDKGNDILDADGGIDTAIFSGAFRQYTRSVREDGALLLQGPDGDDVLIGIENLVFVDGRLVLDPGEHVSQAYRLYLATLDRAPDAVGLNYHCERLDAGTSLIEVASGFVNSPEFQTTYGPRDDAQFVELLYRNVLDRSASPDEIAFHASRLQSGASRADIVIGFSESPEYIGTHRAALWDIDEGVASIARLYFGMLERTPEAAGLESYEDALDRGATIAQIANGFASSPEFQAKYGSLDDAGYVAQLYANILERSPAPEEVAFHVDRLNAGATRGEVAAGFTDALEYQIKTQPLVDGGIAVADAGFLLDG